MKTQKKASVKAQAFCSKLQGKEVAKSTSWADCTDIIFEYFPYCYDMHTSCKSNGDSTIIKLYKGDSNSASKEDLIETFSLPNSEVFIEKDGDWDWPTVYKLLVEYFMKNWKALTKGTKKKKKKTEPVNADALMTRVTELRAAIKSATGTEKKKLIKEYNEKSVLLEGILEKKAAETKVAQEARKASVDELLKLKRRKQALTQRIKEWTAKEKDTTELKKELTEVCNRLAEATTGIKR